VSATTQPGASKPVASKPVASTPGGIFASSKIENRILQTDYLKNPRPNKRSDPKDKTDININVLGQAPDQERCFALLQNAIVSFNPTAAAELLLK
jgi:hypothetical protein